MERFLETGRLLRKKFIKRASTNSIDRSNAPRTSISAANDVSKDIRDRFSRFSRVEPLRWRLNRGLASKVIIRS